MFTLKDEASPRVSRGEVEGNKALDYPVGLITADEISVAGGALDTSNTNYYLYKNSNQFPWSFSPYTKYSGYAHIFNIISNGNLNHSNLNNANGAAAPVINIAPEYAKTMVGTGMINDPYILNI